VTLWAATQQGLFEVAVLKNRVRSAWLGSKQLRFLLIGGLNFLWGLASYPALYWALGPLKLHYMAVLGAAYLINTAVAYLSQKYFVFKTSGNFGKEFAKFLSLQVAIFAINSLVLPVAVEVFKVQPVIAQTLFALLLAVVSFVFHDKVTFKVGARKN